MKTTIPDRINPLNDCFPKTNFKNNNDKKTAIKPDKPLERLKKNGYYYKTK